jgi:hypothetical protein
VYFAASSALHEMYDELASLGIMGFEKNQRIAPDKYFGYLLAIRYVSNGPETYRQTHPLPL